MSRYPGQGVTMSLKIILSMCLMRVPGQLAPFWRDRTKRLVVIVARSSRSKLTAWGIDLDCDDHDAVVFEARFAATRLHGVIAAVLGGDKLVFERSASRGTPGVTSRAVCRRTAARKATRVVVRLPSASIMAFAASTLDPDGDVVVVRDPGVTGGPKKSVLTFARKLFAANATDLPPPRTDTDGGVPRLL
jgi:hypothetical protein